MVSRWNGRGDLEGAADSAIDDPVRGKARDFGAVELHRTRRRLEGAGEHVEDRALARAVGTDQAENLALLDAERHVIDGREAAKPLYQALDFQHDDPFSWVETFSSEATAHAFRSILTLSMILPKIPLGRKMMNTTSSTP